MQKREFGAEEYEPGGQGEQLEEEGEVARYWPAEQVEEEGREVERVMDTLVIAIIALLPWQQGRIRRVAFFFGFFKLSLTFNLQDCVGVDLA